ncbi:MAG: hypothetical protein HYX24_04300 [Candidatus Aenigmarchaeota archaeon]|nr:hypothetical protein [Candidatus Aenigmarchaeota archaeon]
MALKFLSVGQAQAVGYLLHALQRRGEELLDDGRAGQLADYYAETHGDLPLGAAIAYLRNPTGKYRDVQQQLYVQFGLLGSPGSDSTGRVEIIANRFPATDRSGDSESRIETVFFDFHPEGVQPYSPYPVIRAIDTMEPIAPISDPRRDLIESRS